MQVAGLTKVADWEGAAHSTTATTAITHATSAREKLALLSRLSTSVKFNKSQTYVDFALGSTSQSMGAKEISLQKVH